MAELMKAKGFSSRDMADRLPCGKSMVAELANGSRQTCSEGLGDRIAEVLGVATRILFVPAPSVRRGRPSTRKDVAA
jgi:transcriptional regulator with XRE-family HTH domain